MRYVLVIFLGLTASWRSHAQLPALTLDHLTTKEGLPSNDVWCISKDRQGFLWIGTGRSLCRYDGYTFRTLEGEKAGYCSGISADAGGTLYASIATKGLCAIDPGTFTCRTILKNNYNDTDPTNDMHDRAFVDSYGQVWVCDYTTVKRYDPARQKRRQYALSSAGNVHQDATFFEDSARRLWIVSEIGLYRYDRAHDQLSCVLGLEASRPPHKRPIRLEIAFADSRGTIWTGGYDAGLVRFSPADLTFSIRQQGFENQHVICGQESVDENGRSLLFIGTEKGISLYYPDQDRLYHLPEFYNKGIHVKAMYDDKANGILWIGTREGLYKYRYRNPGIHTVNLPASAVPLPVEVTSALQLPDGRYWLGLSHSGALAWQPATGQFRLHRYPVSAYTHQLRLIGNRPVAFTDKGVFVADPESGRFVGWPGVAPLFTTTEFRDGLLDRKGRFWIASLTEGLHVLDPATRTEVRLWSAQAGQNLLRNNYVKAIAEGADGKIWVGTCPNGLYYFDEQQGRFVNIRELAVNKGRSLSGLCINAVQPGSDGSVLLASWGGINKIAPTGEILDSFNFEHDKLADTYCSAVCTDRAGNYWFSTNEGIHIANPKTRLIKYLTTIEGLRSNYPVGFLKNKADELILGHINSINVIALDAVVREKTVPNLAISSIEIKGKVLHQDLTSEILVKPDENILTVTFSTLDFEPASRSQYSYQLEGFDSSWVELGSQHTVSFTNLPARSYVLRVRNSNNFGLVSTHPLLVRFTVKPYFINTWYFGTLIGIAIAGLIVGLMRWRVNTLAERNRLDLQVTEWRLKALQAQMNPHFLFNSLNSVQNYLLTNRGTEGARYLSKFSKLVRRIMENSNHQYLSFGQIIDTLRMYVEIESFRFNHEFSYTFDIEDNEELLDALLPPMLLQPYVENAIWHGLMPKEGEKKLLITARAYPGLIVCTIEDNGVGRAFAPRTEGHISRGQEMTRGILESLRRQESVACIDMLDLVDAAQQPAGTKVVLTIPIEKT